MKKNKHHDLKILPKYYSEVSSGKKTFEIRLNDRDFKTGDTVTLHEFNKEENSMTGSQLTFTIGYVLKLNEFFGSDNKYVIFSLQDLIK